MRSARKETAIEGHRVKFGIVAKMLVGILVPLFAVLILISVFLGLQGSKTVGNVVGAELNAETKAAASDVDSFFKQYYGVGEALASTQVVRDMVTANTEGGMAAHPQYWGLLETLQLIQVDSEQNLAYVWLANLSTGELLQSDGTFFKSGDIDFQTRSWYKLVMEQQDTITTEAYESANGDTNMVTIATPIWVNGSIQGVVGMDLNMESLTQLLEGVTVGTSGYITLYDRNNKILYHPDSTVVNTNAEDADYSSNMLSAIVNKENSDAMRYTRKGTEYYGSTVVIDAVGYTVLGVMQVEEYTTHTTALLRIVIYGMVLCGLLLAGVCVFIALSITRPLKRLNVTVGKLADGELDVEVETHGRDEVSELGTNVVHIVERLREYILYIDEISRVLHQIGQGNLVFDLEQAYVGEFSKIKEALLDIRSKLTETMVAIAQSAAQVNAGSEQIASGAQALAQGATEQASSVEELSSAIQELSGQAADGAQRAVEAGQFLEQIKNEVEKSNEKMGQMQQAMENISVQSAAIRSIIKTIDDIAFQTNILALNAAVEAARAGSAGKGFAVVADEVRNLAGKSAQAAQKTNELIANSVQAVERGEELTKLTADSLAIVADGTKQVVGAIDTVASDYREQASRMSEIAKGVDQISSVVQTNSATAEQSAAASQELSGQANMMSEQVAQFRLGREDEPLDESGYHRDYQPAYQEDVQPEDPQVEEDTWVHPSEPVHSPFDDVDRVTTSRTLKY